MRWWEILEINKNADLRTIKRAYAAKLKTMRPDENPAEFAKLREAYDMARVCLDMPNQRTKYQLEKNIRSKSQLTLPVETKFSNNHDDNVLNDVIALLAKEDAQTNQDAWNNIFDDERLEMIDDFAQFEFDLINYLLEQTKYAENKSITDYYTQLRRFQTPIIRPPISQFIFNRMGWDTHNQARQYYDEIEWLAYQFGVSNDDSNTRYWYHDKLQLSKTLIHVKVKETDMHPGLMLLYTIVFLIVFGIFMGTLARTMFQ